jgi:hypothetical protein
MTAAERHIEKLESEFPMKACHAFSQAYRAALKKGLSVVVAKDGVIWRVHPDGKRERIESMPKRSGKKYPKRISLK